MGDASTRQKKRKKARLRLTWEVEKKFSTHKQMLRSDSQSEGAL